MEKQKAAGKGYHDEKSIGSMLLLSSNGGQEAERQFEFKQLEETAVQGTKNFLKIIKPADLQGTGLLSFEKKGGDDDQWLFLPALKKTKRIAGQGRTGSFIGSEFTYDDLSPRDIDDYKYRYVKPEACTDTTCHVVLGIPQYASADYSKMILWIRSDNYQNVKIEFYAKQGPLKKIATFDDYHLLNNKFWRPYKITMKNVQSGKETRLLTLDLKIQSGLTNSDFTRMVLER